ncbi:MAG: methionine synthase [Phycisphaeraceae bacterium]|nr:methionine synthase [Phycisphaerales bacterium]MCB9861065.1 methionine synthase [Phycisphaeraceae bacterium]
MSSPYLDALSQRLLVIDGAMGTSIHQHDLDLEKDYCNCENCTDLLVATRPDVIQSIHEEFLTVGSDAVETDTFGSNPIVLAEFDLTDRAFELNKQGAEIARAACEKYSTKDKPRFVLGSIGPGTKLITLGNTTWDALHESYRVQASGLIAGGTDALLIETCQDLLQVKCAINACLTALKEKNLSPSDIPISVSVTIETTGSMLLGTSIEAAMVALKGYPIASLGLNCATGPEEMAEHVAALCKHWDRAVSVVPNAGLPVLVDGRTDYPLKPQPMADVMQRYIEPTHGMHGATIIGGCCGTTPEHIRKLAEIAEAHNTKHAKASRTSIAVDAMPPACTSLYSCVDHHQDASVLIIGERMNASGSRKFKQLLEAEDFDGIISLAREQIRKDGAHLLDLNVDYAGRDNVKDMQEIVSRVVRQIDAPLVLDSTQIPTIEAGLKCAPGKCVINSANFEDGEEKFDQICSLATTYGAALVIGSIDEDPDNAMARTADRKLSIAERALRRAVDVHGLDPADIFFDPLVLPISTGLDSDRRSALELINGVRMISEKFPTSQITCGLSNCSFGLDPRARLVLNSALLVELMNAGLTSAILHAGKIVPQNKVPEVQWNAALDLIYDRRHESAGGTGLPEGITDQSFDPLEAFVALFADKDAIDTAKVAAKDLTLEERMRMHIIDGEKEGLIDTLDEALQQYSALDIINDHLLDGMKTVGELFGAGKMQLPFVLQSAEVMKTSVAHLEQFMEKSSGSKSKGSIVLATVKGDVHDIGKNLVDIILTNNGYTVHNIGIKQPISDIVAKWKETNANAIGLSGLLVKSVIVMEENLQELNRLSISVPMLLGGAALTRHYAEGHLKQLYEGELFYCKDAFDGLHTMDRIGANDTASLHEAARERLAKRSDAERTIAENKAAKARAEQEFESGRAVASTATLVRSEVARKVAVPTPPFLGSRVVTDISLDHLYPYINTTALFRGQWQFKKGAMSNDEYQEKLDSDVMPVFENLKTRCKQEGILSPKVVYGYYLCASDGDDLILFDPNDPEKQIERFTFPRQDARKRLCISDFFRSVDEIDPASTDPMLAGRDVIAMHCVTVGTRVSEEAQKLFAADKYTDYLYLHGFGVECAEALAELWHKRIRQELGIAGDDSPRIRDLFTQGYRGSRYSFGYPACPALSDQEILFRLLKPERIDCTLTENWQIDPEQSTSAIVVHHPEARYFAI